MLSTHSRKAVETATELGLRIGPGSPVILGNAGLLDHRLQRFGLV